MIFQRSMTGYGKGEVAIVGKKIIVEIRSLNGKQLDLSVKLPALYRKDELEIRRIIGEKLVRGKCDVFISFECTDLNPGQTINKEIFNSYFNQIDLLCNANGIDVKSQGIVQSILRLPEILSIEKNEVSEIEEKALLEAARNAIESLDGFRKKEGAELLTDILNRIDKIATLQSELKTYENERRQTVEARLRENLNNLKIEIDENRFEQELIYYIEKYDITEEMVRLSSHLNHFKDVCTNEEMCGKKLGFIAQELGREINTTGSKANHVQIQKIVVAMKDELEKIKEQILNLL